MDADNTSTETPVMEQQLQSMRADFMAELEKMRKEKEALQAEKDLFLAEKAEIERMRQEKEALQAEKAQFLAEKAQLERMRKEKEALQAEKEQFLAERAEIERMRREKEALQMEKEQILAEKAVIEEMWKKKETLASEREHSPEERMNLKSVRGRKEMVTVKKEEPQTETESLEAFLAQISAANRTKQDTDEALGSAGRRMRTRSKQTDSHIAKQQVKQTRMQSKRKTGKRKLLKRNLVQQKMSSSRKMRRKSNEDNDDAPGNLQSNSDDLETLEVFFVNKCEQAKLSETEETHNTLLVDEMSMENSSQGKVASHQQKLKHTCKVCGKTFKLSSHYSLHKHTHTGEKPYTCGECFASSHRPNGVGLLQQKHSPANPQAERSQSLPPFTSLRKQGHQDRKAKVKAKVREFACDQCKEVFPKSSLLAVHKAVHTGGKPFRCLDCKATFTSQGNLTVHRRKHSGNKPFVCQHCDATFPRLADLRSHVRKHSTVKPYKCLECGASFCRSGDLKPHLRTHSGERPFQCEVCGAAFSTSSNLSVHRRIHTGERPFQCEKCGAAFSQLGHLTRHRQQHASEFSHKCPTCGLGFGNAYHLKVHMQRHNTDNTFRCTKCGAAFSRASILTEHMRIHTGEKPYKCTECPAAFARSANLAAHRRKHTGERPYKCKHCGSEFTQSTSLNRHLVSKNACPVLRSNKEGVGLIAGKNPMDVEAGDCIDEDRMVIAIDNTEDMGDTDLASTETSASYTEALAAGGIDNKVSGTGDQPAGRKSADVVDLLGTQSCETVGDDTGSLCTVSFFEHIKDEGSGLQPENVSAGLPPENATTGMVLPPVTMVSDYGKIEGVTSPITDAMTVMRNLAPLGSYYHPHLPPHLKVDRV